MKVTVNEKYIFMKKDTEKDKGNTPEDKKFPGYPESPEKDDIYHHEKEEQYENEEARRKKEEGSRGESLDEGLDVPGADLDDPDEAIGEEDEENNYYSLGGDDHDDLEEGKGE